MKYRHIFHAGNFADVHKHITLLALLQALKRKEKGFAYFETHAGAGLYDLSSQAARTSRAAEAGLNRILSAQHDSEELRDYANTVQAVRNELGNAHAYPGSPLLAARALRPQDRAVFMEIDPVEAQTLTSILTGYSRARVECGDGYERLRAHLPPIERRGLVLIDPPYEETRRDFDRVAQELANALRRFETGVIAVWYPIKDRRDSDAWHAALARWLKRPALISELWLFPCDSRVALNGTGMLIVNAPYLLDERMRVWMPELLSLLDVNGSGGVSVRSLGS